MKAMSKLRAFGKMTHAYEGKMPYDILVCYIVFMFLTIFSQSWSMLSNNSYSLVTVPDFSLLSFIVVWLVSRTNASPRFRELPMTYKRRSAYMLARLYFGAAVVAILGITLNILCSQLGPVFDPDDVFGDGTVVTNIYTGVCGNIFAALRYVFVPAYLVIIFRSNGKSILFNGITFMVVYFVLNFIPVLVYNATAADRLGFDYIAATLFCIDNMPLGWLYVAIYALITAAAVVGSVLVVLRRERPTEL